MYKYHYMSFDELVSKAEHEENELALIISDRFEAEVEYQVEKEMEINEDDYSFGIEDAVKTIQYLIGDCVWEKEIAKDCIKYTLAAFNENTHLDQNDLVLTKTKGSDQYVLKIQHGECGEATFNKRFYAKGPVEAQKAAISKIIDAMRFNDLQLKVG